MNKDTKLANLQKTSKVFAVIAKIIEVVNYVGAAICAAAIPVLFINQDKQGMANALEHHQENI